MRFVVGLKFGSEDQGAVALSGWLRAQSSEAVFLAQHSIDPRLRTMDPDIAYQTSSGSHQLAEEAFASVGIKDVDTSVKAEGAPEVNLARSAAFNGADAVIVGRRARTKQHRVVRLGAVARRLLRDLPAPVLVAPPDLASTGIGSGPVLIALDGETQETRAVAFARRFAAATDRKLAVAHVFPSFTQLAAPYVPTAFLTRVRTQLQEHTRTRLEAQIDTAGVSDLPLLTAEGAAVSGLIDLAREAGACLVVCSSRQLTTSARIFESSVGSSLAATAPFAVAVVPR